MIKIFIYALLVFLLFPALFLIACSGDDDDPSTSQGQGGDDDIGDGFTETRISQCEGLGPGKDDCYYRIIWDVSHCEKGCDRLLVYWAGGDQTCHEGGYDPLLEKYAAKSFIAACAQPFMTGDEAGNYPFYKEFDRMDRVMESIRKDVYQIWTGKNLLISGISHGAGASLITIAANRSLADHSDNWTGLDHTAVILYDGMSNLAKLEEWFGEKDGCGYMHQRTVGRYGDGSPFTHSCENDSCYCSDPSNNADWIRDTAVVGAGDPAGPYQCEDFSSGEKDVLYRFVSCGANVAAAPCSFTGNGDMIPNHQQFEPYDGLKECPAITASYEEYSNCGHSLCGGWDLCGGKDSVNWLEQKGW